MIVRLNLFNGHLNILILTFLFLNVIKPISKTKKKKRNDLQTL